MSIVEKLDQDIVAAMKSGDRFRLTVLRTLKSDLKNEQINKGTPLTDDVVIGVLSSSAKKRRDSIEQFGNAGRTDLVDKESAELAILTSYLPQQMSEDDIRKLVAEAIAETGADSPQKAGLVMKALMPKVKGKADGKLVNRLVSEMLAK
jgi:uncharacterized protein